MKTILFVHQSADMYGSDRMLLYLVQGLDKSLFNPIVVLPSDGPLRMALRNIGIQTHQVSLARISRATFSPRGLIRMPFQISSSIRTLKRTLGDLKVDIVHSNTVAVVTGAAWASLHKIPHVWHVHEMIVHPWIAKNAFPRMLNMFSDYVVCNSNATKQLLIDIEPRLGSKSSTIWNGLERTEPVDYSKVADLQRRLAIKSGEILIGLVGRINRWKGQSILIDTAEELWHRGLKNIHYLIVGNTPPGQDYFRTELMKKIDKANSRMKITLMNFTEDIWPVFDACDIIVVPSTEPEPFGMVALEAMAAKKPVIAAAHGGLMEIVENGKTGLLFPPGDVQIFADSIEYLAKNPALREQMGNQGFQKMKNQFSLKKYVSSFESLYESIGSKKKAYVTEQPE